MNPSRYIITHCNVKLCIAILWTETIKKLNHIMRRKNCYVNQMTANTKNIRNRFPYFIPLVCFSFFCSKTTKTCALMSSWHDVFTEIENRICTQNETKNHFALLSDDIRFFDKTIRLFFRAVYVFMYDIEFARCDTIHYLCFLVSMY